MRLKRLSYDSPLILSFAFLSLAVRLLDRLIILSSFAGAGRGELPLTLLLVLVLYLGGELVSMLTVRDNISHLSHILGGLCGAGFGFLFRPRQA